MIASAGLGHSWANAGASADVHHAVKGAETRKGEEERSEQVQSLPRA